MLWIKVDVAFSRRATPFRLVLDKVK